MWYFSKGIAVHVIRLFCFVQRFREEEVKYRYCRYSKHLQNHFSRLLAKLSSTMFDILFHEIFNIFRENIYLFEWQENQLEGCIVLQVKRLNLDRSSSKRKRKIRGLFSFYASFVEQKILPIDKGGGKLGGGRLSSCHEIPSRVGRHPSVTTFQRRTAVGRRA